MISKFLSGAALTALLVAAPALADTIAVTGGKPMM